ncbi:MAG: carbohydrate ABC transporter permease [Natronomonas sp.]|uniref:carbohydrate ABC transporter permease n=1 Tax=Natronomonas sp. TaxID=2184060 RepID=UPI0028700F4E|nr:carbohydrate ABC transporter permease [Natronomonas sp.]MDR9431911.1 carbohydrate ABC transporter permease [Natronomonas sp.]
MATQNETNERIDYETKQRFWGIVRSRYVVHALIFVTLFAVLAPLSWMFITSLKPNDAVLELRYLPRDPILGAVEAYGGALITKGHWQAVLNSFVIAITSTTIVMALGTPAGYIFSRYQFRFDDALFLLVIVTRLFPPIGLIIPYYQIMVWLGLLNTRTGIIIAQVYLWLPLVIYTMRNFYITIPHSLDESAQVDGCTDFQAFRHVILPLVLPGVAASAILTFLFTWREFLFSFIVSSDLRAQTLPVAIYQYIGDIRILWNSLSAAGILSVLPAVLVVFLFQQYIVSGLTGGAVKE